MIKPEVLDALLAAGATADMIVAALKADMAQDEERAASRRASAAARQARRRAKITESHAVSREQSVTERDPSLETKVSPTPPSKTQIHPTPSAPKGASVPADPVEIAVGRWNELARRFGLPVAKSLTAARRKAVAARLREAGPDGWGEALAGVERSAFCVGQRPGNDGREFRADLDFVSQPKSFTRLREGFYGNGAKPPQGQAVDPDALWKARLGGYAENRRWKPDEWGPPPGQPGCRCPASLYVAEAKPMRATA